MRDLIRVKSALVSVYYKDRLDTLIDTLAKREVDFYSTGGTRDFIEHLGYNVHKVEDITSYPPILDGRVKTLHPKIFGGILAIRNEDHLAQLEKYEIPTLDMVVVDLYPFEETMASTTDQAAIIEKIDIGGISLIRAAAKNFQDVVVISSKEDYQLVNQWLEEQDGAISLSQRQLLASKAFAISSRYDMLIYQYMSQRAGVEVSSFTVHENAYHTLRYGENPHQKALFYGDLQKKFDILGGKELSYNNMVDIDAAVQLMREFTHDLPTFCILKHTNACGVSTKDTISEAYKSALACDPVSAFGGVFIANCTIDALTAQEINSLFYEVLIAPDFDADALEILLTNSKRIILRIKTFDLPVQSYKTVLNGILLQDADFTMEKVSECPVVSKKTPTATEYEDLSFALKCAKHLKSNTIALVKNKQLLGMGCGQTSRLDACKQAIEKARCFGFSLEGAVMASDAFFPFPDCVEIAHDAGITSVVQPGGSIKDQLSVDYCDSHGMSMVLTGVRHFKH
jgi:phosphoribosylaminoimidazolecarboxamide formyltransferase/IMP cyclohydrolase